MLKSEGYKMFHGTATVASKNPKFVPLEITGDWLYKPEADCWYVMGRSFPAELVVNIRESEDDFLRMLEERFKALEQMAVSVENAEAVKTTCKEMGEWMAEIRAERSTY